MWRLRLRYWWRRYVLGIKPKPITNAMITREALRILREKMHG